MEKLLTIKEMAEMLRWSPKTIQNKISAEQMPIPFIKLGPGNGKVRFKKDVVEAYLNKRTILQKPK